MSANVIGAMISRVNIVGPHAFPALHPQNWGPRNVNIMVQWINEPAAVRSPGSGCFNYLKKYYKKQSVIVECVKLIISYDRKMAIALVSFNQRRSARWI